MKMNAYWNIEPTARIVAIRNISWVALCFCQQPNSTERHIRFARAIMPDDVSMPDTQTFEHAVNMNMPVSTVSEPCTTVNCLLKK